jgi:YbbR domain-containing protein
MLAIVFWVWLTSQSNATLFNKNIIPVQLVAYNQPSNIAIITPIPTITIRIDSSSQESSTNPVAYVDLKDAVAGESTYDVQINAPEGVKVEEISPKSVTLKLDQLEDKIVKVEANVTGEPASGYEAGEMLFTPSVVNVRGPASILANLESVIVNVDFTGLTESKSVVRPVTYEDIENKGIFAADPYYKSLQAFPDTVEVIMPVYPKGNASKTVSLRVATKGTPADGMEVRLVTPLPSQIKLVGAEEKLKSIQYLNLGTVDISGITSTKTIDISLNSIKLPEGVSFSQGTKLSVMVYVDAKAMNETIKGIPVGIKNIPDGLAADIISPIDIKVSGYPDILAALQQGDISVWVDAKGLKEGTYSDTTVLWEVPSGVTMMSVPKVQLVLKASAAASGDNKE